MAVLTPVGFVLTSATVVVGLALWEGVQDLFEGIFSKRDLELAHAGGSQVACQWDTTNLRGK